VVWLPAGGADRCRPVSRTRMAAPAQRITASAANDGGPGQGLAQQEASPANAQDRLDQLALAHRAPWVRWPGRGTRQRSPGTCSPPRDNRRHQPLGRCPRTAVAVAPRDSMVRKTISGDASTSAQDTVCQAPSSRASRPPSAYPVAAATTAPRSSRSARCSCPKPPELQRWRRPMAARAPSRGDEPESPCGDVPGHGGLPPSPSPPGAVRSPPRRGWPGCWRVRRR
jgi:hypothetical protein